MTRLVLLSGRGEPEAQAAEDELMRSEAEWTVVRASWFAQNFSESLFAPGIMSGEVHLPLTRCGSRSSTLTTSPMSPWQR